MPASLALEEKLLKATLQGETYTALGTVYVGLSKLTAVQLKKSTTAKEFGEAEPQDSNWKRIAITAESGQWETLEKGEGATGFSKLKNKFAVKFEKILGSEEIKLETFAICEKVKTSEGGNILYFGTLATPVTINKATTSLEIPAKELIVEAE